MLVYIHSTTCCRAPGPWSRAGPWKEKTSSSSLLNHPDSGLPGKFQPKGSPGPLGPTATAGRLAPVCNEPHCENTGSQLHTSSRHAPRPTQLLTSQTRPYLIQVPRWPTQHPPVTGDVAPCHTTHHHHSYCKRVVVRLALTRWGPPQLLSLHPPLPIHLSKHGLPRKYEGMLHSVCSRARACARVRARALVYASQSDPNPPKSHVGRPNNETPASSAADHLHWHPE
jgi:hypothetical protein